MRLDDTARAVFNAMTEGVLIIDIEGKIVFGNEAYRRFLLSEACGGQDIEGRPLRELRPGARLPEVLETRRPILHAPRQETDDIYFVNMYPVFENGVLTGGISVVTFIRDAYDFQAELEKYEKHSRQVLRRINKANSAHYTFDSIIASTPEAMAIKSLAQKIAVTDATVLLASESGTGKELYAQSIHNASPRADRVFVAINCANFNPSILESELFGYVEGAFTGAKKGGKLGLFEAASGGTLFLDEISEMELGLQAKLLRALQERRIRPVGGVEEIEVDVRIIAACNADLSRYVGEGKFRTDLYYRLNTFPIHIPPLRDRPSDIPILTKVMLDELSRKLKRTLSIAPEAVALLQNHDWPGNVRELRNVLEFSAYLTPDGVIGPEALPENMIRSVSADASASLPQRVKAFEKTEIQRLLQKYGSDLNGKRRAAKTLGISLASLYNKLGKRGF